MNLINDDFQQKEIDEKSKKAKKLIISAIVMIIIAIVLIMAYISYLNKSILKIYVDGKMQESMQPLFVFENDEIYVPIKDIAPFLKYEVFKGDYIEKSEDKSRCYAQSQTEIANFAVGSNLIYKLDLTDTTNTNYEKVKIGKEVKSINGELHITTEGLQKAFNVTFKYDKENNSISIFTLPYLIKFYTNKVMDYGYTGISSSFGDQKAVMKNMLVVSKENGNVGVIDVNGNTVIEPKYDKITYLSETEEFLVQSKDKVGIIKDKDTTKLPISFNSIKLMDSDKGLYLVGKDNNFGVYDSNGKTRIYIENEEIGIDISKFSENGIKNKYILPNGLIPVKKDQKWGLYDTEGRLVTDFVYDSFGYIASGNKKTYNLLMIAEYDVMVACKDKKYTLLDKNGNELINPIADDIYMTKNKDEIEYCINVNDEIIDAIEIIEKQLDIRPNKEKNDSEKTNTTEEKTEQSDNNNTEKKDEEKPKKTEDSEKDKLEESNQKDSEEADKDSSIENSEEKPAENPEEENNSGSNSESSEE